MARHTYGLTCQLAPPPDLLPPNSEDYIPHLNAQFFYSSPLPIDDPLSPVPNTTSSESKAIKHPPRPFSNYDNKALEETWQSLVPKSWRTSLKVVNKDPRESGGSSSVEIPKGLNKPDNDVQSSDFIRLAEDVRIQNIEASSSTVSTPRPDLKPLGQFLVEDDTPDSTMTISKTSKRLRKSKMSNYGMHISQEGQQDHGISDVEASKIKLIDTTSSSVGCGDTEEDSFTEPENCVACKETSPSWSPVREDIEIVGDFCPVCIREAQENGTEERSLEPTQKDLKLSMSSPKSRSTNSFRSCKPDKAGLDGKDGKSIPGPPLALHTQASAIAISNSTSALNSRVSSSSISNSTSTSNNQFFASSVPISTSVVENCRSGGNEDSGTSGLPFVKLASRSSSPQPPTADHPFNGDGTDLNQKHERQMTGIETVTMQVHTCKTQRKTERRAEVPVGISRLHVVKLPELVMEPIYWSPVHDISSVTRATWFYRDTLFPVEPTVANQLESGYRELRPWSQTWKDELNSAIEVGAAGEEKIVHRLWPKEEPKAKSQKASCTLSSSPHCAAHCFHGEAAAEGNVELELSEKATAIKTLTKKYTNAQVIYEDSRKAYILKPNLQPSAYYGRKPLQKIKKGICVGIPVLRGFDWKAFEKLHPSKVMPTRPEAFASVSNDAKVVKGEFCPACRAHDKRPEIKELLLVIHGIGQKLSERVESFHFTHAINQFRQQINVESSIMHSGRPQNQTAFGTMTLPVNWRNTLSFEEGGLMKNENENEQKLGYSLSDVTQESLPAVRKMISDVMLDIPYYMSHHKPKMIQAVIQEANRIYKLWCKNNPGFEKGGRVHIIAHSLGSAMALEILSRQPTSVPKLNLSSKKTNIKHFDFKTTNLFFVGSPAGFFLLLDQSKLLPRQGQRKPDAELRDDGDKVLTGEAGVFGCLAVDNIYNILHYNDPIAYRLNPCVDNLYATQLKEAQVPSASTSFFEGIGNAVRGMIPGVSAPSDVPIGQVAKPVGVSRLPSQLEMEVHDFTREEIAEKKFYLLNDNGQVDWYLNSGQGSMTWQYLNMLSAHSSYWLNPDFIRFVVVEIGRQPGKNHTLPSIKASKKARK